MFVNSTAPIRRLPTAIDFDLADNRSGLFDVKKTSICSMNMSEMHGQLLALLLVFEFINLLIHLFLGNITHHSPVLMLLCMVILASMLIPLHHKLEHFIKHKLIEKNKAIRLAAAKKTLDELQEESEE